jgi:hypothetical protein
MFIYMNLDFGLISYVLLQMEQIHQTFCVQLSNIVSASVNKLLTSFHSTFSVHYTILTLILICIYKLT